VPGFNKIVPFVEGQGDIQAVPILARRVLAATATEKFGSSSVHFLDAWRVGHLHKLLASDGAEWFRLLNAAARTGASGVLLVLDGDRLAEKCPGEVARSLAASAKSCGAGAKFSLSVVFAMQEIESWYIPDAQALIERASPHAKISLPKGNLETGVRDAKGWLSKNMVGGYKPTIHQSEFARSLDIQKVRSQNLRSFRRFEHAVTELIDALISGVHIATP
jgi:hypothetical protein